MATTSCKELPLLVYPHGGVPTAHRWRVAADKAAPLCRNDVAVQADKLQPKQRRHYACPECLVVTSHRFDARGRCVRCTDGWVYSTATPGKRWLCRCRK